MEPTALEVNLSRVLLLQNELATGEPVDTKSRAWHGTLRGVYGKNITKERLDAEVAFLCETLQRIDVSKYSLEMQIWWRDHQEADRIREAKEKEENEYQAIRAAALKKLTNKERKVLGLE
jgi:hypothetical protein